MHQFIQQLAVNNMKAVAFNNGADTTNNKYNLRVEYFDSTGVQTENQTLQISLTGTTSPELLRQASIDAIVSDAVGQGYSTFTEADIFFAWPNIDVPNSKALSGVLKTGIINGTVTGNTNILTVPSSKEFFTTAFLIRTKTVTALITPPTLSFGDNATPNNIVSSTTLTAVTVANEYKLVVPDSGAVVSPAGNTIKVRVATAAVGTTYDFEVTALGMFKDV